MDEEMWRPPINRMMRTLDRAFFQRDVLLKAVRVLENKNISKCRNALERSKDLLMQDRVSAVCPDPDAELAKAGRRCILLRPESDLQHDNGPDPGTIPWPHSSKVAEMVEEHLVSVIPYSLHLDYSHWTYFDIISSIWPEGGTDEIPSGFTQSGHVAHLNLRREHFDLRYLIAEVLLDKNPSIRTVINKIDDVGDESEFRTFKYEVLSGPDDMNVTVSEENCTFTFDFSKVYWNSRLHTEHQRIVRQVKEGEAICDVMAGIGPFAVPAGKRKIFAWASDLNPDSYKYLQAAIARNRVQGFVRPFNEDARQFIPRAVAELAATEHKVEIIQKSKDKTAQTVHEWIQPKTFQHFVLNLPATALTFLPSFIGIYTPAVRELLPDDVQMPLIHVYCFNTKSDDNVEEGRKICQEISEHLKYEMHPGRIDEGKVEIHDVRDVAPAKRMFCASFRLPEEVAYRTV